MGTPRQYTWAQIMLTLAAISYRGFELTQPGPEQSVMLYEAMTKCLNELNPVSSQWDIVWGPASLSPSGLGFADTAAYVAKYQQKESTYAVVVRGTNPICLYDWVFGDFMVTTQVPWAYGGDSAAGSMVSFSTMLGLSLLQHLRWRPHQPVKDRVLDLFHSLADNARGVLGLPGSHDPVSGIRDTLTGLAQFAPTVDSNALMQWIAEIQQRPPLKIPGTNRSAWEEARQRLQAQVDLPKLGTGIAESSAAFASGLDLRSFLAEAVRQSSQTVDVYVTGHSKGGALSSTLALWLADTQGTDVPEEDRWDPGRRAVISAYSFAGPTAGNPQFARHSDAVIGPRCFRIINELDVVPHVWAASDLAQIPDLYPTNTVIRDLLSAPIGALKKRLQGLEYQHVGDQVTRLVGIRHPEMLLAEIVHQHLDGYFEQMDLANEMSTETFFKPLSV